MELDDLKSEWKQYDKKLTENLKLNKELLRKMNLNNSKREMQKPLINEIIAIPVMFLFAIWIIVYSFRLINEPKYSIPGFISAIISLVYFIFAIIKTSRFLRIDYYGSSVLKLQKEVAILNKLVLQLRKFEIILTPLLVLPPLPLAFKVIRNIDLYQNIILFIIETVLILAGGLSIYLWINRHLYDEKFKNTERFLKEIENFESEK